MVFEEIIQHLDSNAITYIISENILTNDWQFLFAFLFSLLSFLNVTAVDLVHNLLVCYICASAVIHYYHIKIVMEDYPWIL